MTHELKKIVEAYVVAQKYGRKSVLATVVALEGSSYRRPGVRMLLLDNGQMIGAVSGGCVEKEIQRQAASVFSGGISKVMTYDGRFRLGCEGILYVLLEPFRPNTHFLDVLANALQKRDTFKIKNYFTRKSVQNQALGSVVYFKDEAIPVFSNAKIDTDLEVFEEVLQPCFKLILVGAEHDAVQLCSLASLLGWEVSIVAHPTEEKVLSDFPGASVFLPVLAENFDVGRIDAQTAIVLMNHSYVKDLQFLIAFSKSRHAYLGLLGPNKRREELLNEFLEHCPDVPDDFFNRIYGPSGLNIGAETPQEIAVAILAEILSVIRNKEPMRLRDKHGGIHS